MDKQRTENMASDNTELNIKDVRSDESKRNIKHKPSEEDLREKTLNEEHVLANKRSQKNAEHDAKYGDASDGESSRLPKHQLLEHAHVPQG